MPLDSASRRLEHRSFHHSRHDEAPLPGREQTVSVSCVPARESSLPAREWPATIGPIVALLDAMRGAARR